MKLGPNFATNSVRPDDVIFLDQQTDSAEHCWQPSLLAAHTASASHLSYSPRACFWSARDRDSPGRRNHISPFRRCFRRPYFAAKGPFRRLSKKLFRFRHERQTPFRFRRVTPPPWNFEREGFKECLSRVTSFNKVSQNLGSNQ